MCKKDKFVPYEKLSKKDRRAVDQARRQSWGELNPVTRCPENSRAYDRKAENRRWKADHREGGSDQGRAFFIV